MLAFCVYAKGVKHSAICTCDNVEECDVKMPQILNGVR